jgi:hypothetical protein
MDDFVPRGSCGPWPEWLKAMYVWGNVMVFTAYIAIPFALYAGMRYRLKRQFKQDRAATYGFIAFIFMCGTGHLLDGVMSFVWPNYYVFAVWHLLTGVVSWYTALRLPRALREIN